MPWDNRIDVTRAREPVNIISVHGKMSSNIFTILLVTIDNRNRFLYLSRYMNFF